MQKYLVAAILLGGGACGHRPAAVGTIVADMPFVKARLGPSSPDLPRRGFVAEASLLRVRVGNVLGDQEPEHIVERADRRGVDVRDTWGTVLLRIEAPEYLAEFGAVPGRDGRHFVVLYGYPNGRRGGTFRVFADNGREVGRWEEAPAPGPFGVGIWAGSPALFYLQGARVIVRSAAGALLHRLPAPGGGSFSRVHAAAIAGGHTVVVATGNGYTPYHMVCVYNPTGQLGFQEVAREHAFGVEGDANRDRFVVLTRSSRWAYRPG